MGIEPGATENATAVMRLLTRLGGHGLATNRRYLFIIDGAKALRAAIEEVCGSDQPAKRCSNHIAGRHPRFPEGCSVLSRASPYEPGSLASTLWGRTFGNSLRGAMPAGGSATVGRRRSRCNGFGTR